MTWFVLIGLTLAWGYSVFRDAGTVTEAWSVSAAAVGLIAAVYFVFSKRSEAPRRPPVFLLALLLAPPAFVALQAVPLPLGVVRAISPARAAIVDALSPVTGPAAMAPLTNNLNLTLQRGIQMLACVLLLLLVRDLFWRLRERPWAVAAPLIAVAALQAVLGLVQYGTQGQNAIARGTYANRNHFAGLLEMCLPFALMLAVAVMKRKRSRHSSPAAPAIMACALLALAASMLLGVLLSLSRMGFLATLSALLVGGALSLSSGKPGWRRWVPASAVGVAVLLGFVFLPTDQLIARFANLAETEDISGDTRALIWKDTMRMVGDYPAVGCGFGAFEPTMVKYQTVAPLNAVNFAHNDYLQFLAELGWPAAITVLCLFLWIFGGAIAGAAGPRGSEQRLMSLACAAAFTALLLHSLVDFNIYVPANTMLAAWVGGIAEGLRTWRARRRSPLRDAGLPEFIESKRPTAAVNAG